MGRSGTNREKYWLTSFGEGLVRSRPHVAAVNTRYDVFSVVLLAFVHTPQMPGHFSYSCRSAVCDVIDTTTADGYYYQYCQWR